MNHKFQLHKKRSLVSKVIALSVALLTILSVGLTNDTRAFGEDPKAADKSSAKKIDTKNVGQPKSNKNSSQQIDVSGQSVFDKIDKILTLKKAQKNLVDDSIKDKKTLDRYNPAFFLMMNKVSKLPSLNATQFAELPKYNLLKDFISKPAQLRFLKLRTTVRIWKVVPLDMEKIVRTKLSRKYWPDLKKRIYMIQATLPKKKGAVDQCLVLYTTEFPKELARDTLKYDKHSKQKVYHYRGRKFEVASIFLRIASANSVEDLKNWQNDSEPDPIKELDYPVFLAWQISPKHKVEIGGQNPLLMIVGFFIGAVAIVGFFFYLKSRMIKNQNTSVMWADYVPLRDLDDVDPETGEKRELTEEEIEVDPKLKNAVIEYLKQKQSLEDQQAKGSSKSADDKKSDN